MPTHLALIAAIACAGLLATASAVAAEAPSLDLQLLGPGATGPARIVISGVATDGCPPTLTNVIRDGRDITVRAAPASTACIGQPRPFALSSQAARAEPLDLQEPGVYRLRFELQASPQSTPQLEAFRLVEIGERRQRFRPETGFWWGEQGAEYDRAGPGFGVQLEVQGGNTAVAISGYADDGAPQWLFGAAPLDGDSVSIPLGRLQGGRGPYGRFRSPEALSEAGRVHIEWLGSARALFWFERAALDGRGIELHPVSMVRFGFAGGDRELWLGRWLLAAEHAADDAGIAPRAFDFERMEPQPDGFSLLTGNGERLDCRTAADRPTSPPAHCRLQRDGEAAIEFDDVALARLRGRLDSPDRAAAVLLRLDQEPVTAPR